jgi:hypothetical protein
VIQEELYKHVQTFASTAPSDQAARYETAAQSFRIPYWDWARGEDAGPVPDFFTTPRIDVIRPDGTHDSLWNPLYSYYFHPLIPDDFNGKVKENLAPSFKKSNSSLCSGQLSMQPRAGPAPMPGTQHRIKPRCSARMPNNGAVCTIMSTRRFGNPVSMNFRTEWKKRMGGYTALLVVGGRQIHIRGTCGRSNTRHLSHCSCCTIRASSHSSL